MQLLLKAGHETTVNLIGSGMLSLMSSPKQRGLAAGDLDLVPRPIEEMLRFNGPVETTFPSFAFEPMEIGGKVIEQGDIVIPVLLAANREPAQFVEPDIFDVRREPNRHLAFGSGIHYCLGAPLAPLEGSVVMRNLLARFPSIDLTIRMDDIEWTPGFSLRGVRRLPISIEEA